MNRRPSLWSSGALFGAPILVLLPIAATSIRGETVAPLHRTDLPARITFGSCAHQDKPQPVLNTVREAKPTLFVYLGDNIYGDTRDMTVLRDKYARLAAKPEFQALRREVPVLAVWDDHDYGENDAGKEYPRRLESERIFLDFWQVPADSPRRTRPGIYGAHRFERDGKSLQILLLDTRSFRDPLKRNPDPLPAASPYKNDYQPDPDPAKTLLGETQWAWLEERLREPATIRILCSSIQFGHQYNGWESWTNLPGERGRLLELIRRTRANGVIVISGDVHWGEISRRDDDLPYPLFDVTASGLTEDWYNVEPNRFRVGEAVRENHFGRIDIDWDDPNPPVTLQIVDVEGSARIRQTLRAGDLRW